MIGPPRTFESVVRELHEGLIDGTITLSEARDTDQEPIQHRKWYSWLGHEYMIGALGTVVIVFVFVGLSYKETFWLSKPVTLKYVSSPILKDSPDSKGKEGSGYSVSVVNSSNKTAENVQIKVEASEKIDQLIEDNIKAQKTITERVPGDDKTIILRIHRLKKDESITFRVMTEDQSAELRLNPASTAEKVIIQNDSNANKPDPLHPKVGPS